jgi:hypothetical protein
MRLVDAGRRVFLFGLVSSTCYHTLVVGTDESKKDEKYKSRARETDIILVEAEFSVTLVASSSISTNTRVQMRCCETARFSYLKPFYAFKIFLQIT